MRVFPFRNTAIILIAVAWSNLAHAQTMMDFFVSRKHPHNAAVCAPAAAESPPAWTAGWETRLRPGGVPAVALSEPGSAEVTCAAPRACRPRHTSSAGSQTVAPSRVVPSTPRRVRQAPQVSRCRCQRANCRCRHQTTGESGASKRRCCCCCCSGWYRAHTTGDLFPHFPYAPEHGGVYYFRPYNADTVYEHLARTTYWGIHPGNPYSVVMFDAVHEEFSQRFPAIVPLPEPGWIRARPLPDLEDLLRPIP